MKFGTDVWNVKKGRHKKPISLTFEHNNGWSNIYLYLYNLFINWFILVAYEFYKYIWSRVFQWALEL